MKKNNVEKIIIAMLVFILIISMTIPAFAADTGTVNVRFVIKNSQGAYKNTNIQFGKNTKKTNSNGTAEFRLKDIPAVTTVNAHLVDTNSPSGIQSKINLGLINHEFVQVVATAPGSCELNIIYTKYTKTIVIEYFVDKNSNYSYKKATFEHKKTNKQKSNPTTKPAPKPTPAPPKNENHNPHHPDGFDPDMPPEEFLCEPPHEQFHEEFHEEFHEDMHHEEFHEEFHEDMHHEEFFEDEFPEHEYYGEPFILWTIPGYIWVIIIIGFMLFVTGIVLIIVIVNKKKS